MPGQEPHGWIYDEVAAHLDMTAVPPPGTEVVFEWRSEDQANPVDWITANPAIEIPPTPERLADEYEHLVRLTASRQAARDWAARVEVIDEKFVLTAWQRDLVEGLFCPSKAGTAEEVWASIGIGGAMYHAPVNTPPAEAFVAAHVWDAVHRTPRRDGEMLNRVIDEVESGVHAKIARMQCPRFPRAE